MKICDMLRPLMRVCPRQSMAALGYLGAGYAHNAQWKDVWPRYRSYFDRQLQCVVTADLAEWGGRSCYYWGRFFDVTHQAVLRKFLAPGDTYIDIGANVGYQSLYASRLVGSGGLVLSFEPNPATYSILAGHVGINRIANCRTFQMALSDTDGEATLSQMEEHSGTSNLRPQSNALHSVAVPVRRGDDVLRDIPFPGKAFLKIDVEGFEQQVLIGLRETLDRIAVAAVEVTPEWIAQQGGSAEQLYRYMEKAGFRALTPKIHWRMGLFALPLQLDPITHPIQEQHDVVFVR
jgi:FkbM family methyltransferase